MFPTTKKITQMFTDSLEKVKSQEEEKYEEEEKIPHASSADHFQLKKFRNGDLAIAYKENFVDGKASPSDLTYKIMQRREENLRNKKRHVLECDYLGRETENYQGLLLEKSAEGKWFIKDNMTHQLFEPQPDISYIFVTMPSGKIRISTRGENGHVSLSSLARYVKYAGEVIFDKNQEIISWNNASYSYFPPSFLAFQANLEGMRFFSKKVDRNDPQMETAPIFSRT